MKNISFLINQNVRKFAERVHEEFSEVPVIKMLKMCCELQQICGFEPSEEKEEETIKDC